MLIGSARMAATDMVTTAETIGGLIIVIFPAAAKLLSSPNSLTGSSYPDFKYRIMGGSINESMECNTSRGYK